MADGSKIEWTEDWQTITAAKRIGVSASVYCEKRSAGQKWCTACQCWHDNTAFGKDSSRGDGLASSCLASRKSGNPRGYQGRTPINQETGRPGPSPAQPRHGDANQARHKVNLEVRSGRIPHPNTLPCSECDHLGDDKRHEYHHHNGYGEEHHLDVVVVCTSCHRQHHKRGSGATVDGREHREYPR